MDRAGLEAASGFARSPGHGSQNSVKEAKAMKPVTIG